METIQDKLRIFLILVCACFITSCGSTRPDEQMPVVNVSYFRPADSEGLAPVFEVGLHIINPANTTLRLNGMAYTIKLEGQRVLVGVANDLPEIGPYSEGDAVIRASTDMVGSFLLISRLIQEKPDGIRYEFSARLDVAGMRRDINVVREGEFSFQRKQ